MGLTKRGSKNFQAPGACGPGEFFGRPWRLATVLLLLVTFSPNLAVAEDYFVETQRAYRSALKTLKPGDVIILRDGEWRDFKIVFEGEGR